VADELYGLAPGAFIAARTVREKEARSAGDRDLASRIRQLGKPSTAAWLVNQLVREHPEAVLPLLDLGAGLRAAAAALDGPQLRELDRQQYQLVHALVRVARTTAAAAGQQVSQDTARAVEDTVRAALADDEVAERLRAGRLTEARHPGGFPVPASPTVPAAPATATAAAAPASLDAHREARQRTGDRAARAPAAVREQAAAAARAAAAEREQAARLRAAEQDEDRERDAAEVAAGQLSRERAGADGAAQERQEAMAVVDRLRADLDAALTRQSTAESRQTAAQSAVEVAQRASRAAHQRLTDAIAHREALQRSPAPGSPGATSPGGASTGRAAPWAPEP